jgi:hypothetical protein
MLFPTATAAALGTQWKRRKGGGSGGACGGDRGGRQFPLAVPSSSSSLSFSSMLSAEFASLLVLILLADADHADDGQQQL